MVIFREVQGPWESRSKVNLLKYHSATHSANSLCNFTLDMCEFQNLLGLSSCNVQSSPMYKESTYSIVQS